MLGAYERMVALSNKRNEVMAYLTPSDMRMIIEIENYLHLTAGGCSLDSSPKKNWVENEGGLPEYICEIARAVMRGGKSKSHAIAIAVATAKKWAAGGDDVKADTRAKAAAAVASWEKKKASSHLH